MVSIVEREGCKIVALGFGASIHKAEIDTHFTYTQQLLNMKMV